MNKVCTKCKVEKPLAREFFHSCKKSKNGFQEACKECRNKAGRIRMKKLRSNVETRSILVERTKEWRRSKVKENPNFYKEQYVKNPEPAKKRSNKFYHNNTEKCLEAQKKWRKNNPDTYMSSSRKWKKNNREKYLQQHREWTKRNADYVRTYNQARRALKLAATVYCFSFEELQQRMSMFGNKCAYCSGSFDHVDHVIPLSKGGRHCLANLRPACRFCNLSKHNKKLSDWLKVIK